ncbi:TonB-dependent receptor [Flavobacterium sp.]|uniref:TonB-dependent receptor n=1 Tax=Flavobacterium sp. TaxID=239 RepID=UPI00286E54C3|nr:TonB-dependent receptor [Flavobacterium sp.]
MKFQLYKKQIILLLVLFASFISHSQTKTITGVVSDTLNIPLESANVIAKPLQPNFSLKFAIADNKGRYRLELENIAYEISVSYIGYREAVLRIEQNSTLTSHNFVLKNTGEVLKEIIIKHKFKPIIIKKDTLVFDVKSFANGNERKMKEILEKLPGVEVDKNGGVTVQGKKVTKMLVEGKSFFGGGSKLAVENIPADALDKIEVIDHFNEVGFMKKVSDSDELAMNVKLKEDKKEFVFGDVESGAEVAGNNGFYRAHSGLFYYSPKTNISFIGDSNNIGKSIFSFDDLMRFNGGASSFLSGRKSLTNLFSFSNDNKDVVQNKSQFSAVNFSYTASPKLLISGFGLFSKGFTASRSENRNNYLQNNLFSIENRSENNTTRSLLGTANLKFDYSPNEKEKFFYNTQYQSSNNAIKSNSNSTTNTNSTVFDNTNNAYNISIKQYIEWHKNLNENHTATLVVNHSYEKSTPENNWFTNQPFLLGLIPLQNDNNYVINQIKKATNNSIDALFKHYWILNDFNHLYTNIGNNNGTASFQTSEKQIITTGTINDFSLAGFGNAIKYNLNDGYLGLEYKFKIGKWINKPGIYFHLYHVNIAQIAGNNSFSKTLIQPQWNSDYEFNQSESINFTYKLSNTFPEVIQLTNNFTLQSYNTVFKGNALLENEQFHSANLRYSKINMYQGINWNVLFNYNKKVKTMRNQIEIIGINQYNTPILTDNPETNWRVVGSFSKKIYRFSLKLNTNLNWFNYIQTINNVTTSNDKNNQKVGLSIKTAYRKWPDFNIGYTKGYNQLSGLTKTNYKSDEFNADFEFTFLKSWTFYIEYENLKNTNNNNQSNFYDIANSSLRYQKKNSPFGFEFTANNFLNNEVKNNYSFSDFLISEQTIFVLPRVLILSVSYKL